MWGLRPKDMAAGDYVAVAWDLERVYVVRRRGRSGASRDRFNMGQGRRLTAFRELLSRITYTRRCGFDGLSSLQFWILESGTDSRLKKSDGSPHLYAIHVVSVSTIKSFTVPSP